MKHITRMTGLAFTLLAAQASASAQLIVPISETREVASSADTDDLVVFDSDSDTQTALLYEYFAASVSSTAEIDNGFANGGAAQDSLLGSEYIIASGSAFAVGESYDFNVLSEAHGFSVASVEFDLTAKVSYRWHGSLSASDNGIADVSLSGDGFSTGMSAFGPSEQFVIDETGVLDAGRYTIHLVATGGASATGDLDFAFSEFMMTFEVTPLSGSFCVAAANSTGAGATLGLAGSQNIRDNDFRLGAAGARPNGTGLFFYGPGQIQAPFGDGFRCVGGQTYRVQPPVFADGSGSVTRQLDFTTAPANGATGGAILPMSTWNFQLWYRDPAGPGGSGFNMSDGLWVTFCP